MTTKIFYVVRSYYEPLPIKTAIAGCPYVEAAIVRHEGLIGEVVKKMEAAYIYVTKLTQKIIDGRILDEQSEIIKIKGAKPKAISKATKSKRPGLKDYDHQFTPVCVSKALATCKTNQERLAVALELIKENEERSKALCRNNNLYLVTQDFHRFATSNKKVVYFPLSTTDKNISYLAVERPDLSPLVAKLFSLYFGAIDTLEMKIIDSIRQFLKKVKESFKLTKCSIRQQYHL